MKGNSQEIPPMLRYPTLTHRFHNNPPHVFQRMRKTPTCAKQSVTCYFLCGRGIRASLNPKTGGPPIVDTPPMFFNTFVGTFHTCWALYLLELTYRGMSYHGQNSNVNFLVKPTGCTISQIYFTSQSCTASFTSSSAANRPKLRAYLRGPNRWKSEGARSGL